MAILLPTMAMSGLRASVSEPASLAISATKQPPSTVQTYKECQELRVVLREQLEAFAIFNEAAAKQARHIKERVCKLDPFNVLPAVQCYTQNSGPFDVWQKPRLSGMPSILQAGKTYLGNRPVHPIRPLSTGLLDQDTSLISDIARRTECFAALVLEADAGYDSHSHVKDILRHKNQQLWDLFDEKETLRLEVASTQEDLRIMTKHINDCVDASSVALEVERGLRFEMQTKAQRSLDALRNENMKLVEACQGAERELALAQADAGVWKMKTQNIQNMQEMAMAAFERCNALDAENIELKQAMHTFAESSPSVTVQQLQKIIETMTVDITQYKKREADFKTKGHNARDKENTNMMKEWRKKTKVLQRRSLQKDVKMLSIGNTSRAAAPEHPNTQQINIQPAPAGIGFSTIPSSNSLDVYGPQMY